MLSFMHKGGREYSGYLMEVKHVFHKGLYEIWTYKHDLRTGHVHKEVTVNYVISIKSGCIKEVIQSFLIGD